MRENLYRPFSRCGFGIRIDSMQIPDQAFEAAGTFKPMGKEQLSALLAKTAQAAAAVQVELFKTSQHFDTTAEASRVAGSGVRSGEETRAGLGEPLSWSQGA